MNIIPAEQASEEKLNSFLNTNEKIDKHLLIASGYVAEENNEIIGCFVLDAVQTNKFWLKQLYITRSKAIKLPILLESILALAKQRNAKQVFVRSHLLLVDIILEALQFYPQTEEKLAKTEGKMWTYNVN